jgi:2-polyprenyl-3-methyl-5-hydroxy-6-metoxy-1,4-benzoquinol methylase/RimJ/RimL family protein N-acetyltransferase
MNDLVEKNRYGFFSLRHKPSPNELKEYYEEKYHQENSHAKEQGDTDEEITYLKNKIEQKHHLFSGLLDNLKSRSLLDIGCGQGYCLSYFDKRGWRVLGLDFSDYGLLNHNPGQAANLKKGDIYDNIKMLHKQQKQYDVIWIDNVLEHVLDPLRLLTDCFSLANDNGILIIEVPNDFSIIQFELKNRGIIKDDFWVAVPDHISYFNRNGLCNLCSESGWQTHRIVADFPIDFNLFNPNADYISQKKKGKGAHLQRITIENIIHRVSIEKTNDFYESLADLGMGRQIIGVFVKEKEKPIEPSTVEKYICLSEEKYVLNDYALVALRKQDIYQIKEWRNVQIDVLRQKRLLTDAVQENYYQSAILPTYRQPFPRQILFSILRNEVCIGYGGLVNISWEDRRAEISFLVDHLRASNEAQYEGDFTNYLTLIKRIAFEELDLNRLFLETYDIRSKHIRIIENSGFSLEGRLRQHVTINGKKVDSLLHGMVKQAYRER